MKNFPVLPDYPVIDAHMHPYIAADRNFAFKVPENFTDFFAVQQAAGIRLSCGTFNETGAGKSPERLKECNRKVLEINHLHPENFYPGVNVSPLLPELSCELIENFHRRGFRWIGELAWYVMGYEKYFLPGMKEICARAGELEMTVNLHPSSLEDLDELLTAFPGTWFVIAHPESTYGISGTYTLAQKHKNMFIDLSGSGLFRMGMLRKGVDIMGAERILFGTDYPICNPAMNVAGVLFEELSETEQKMILHDNFLNLTGFTCGR